MRLICDTLGHVLDDKLRVSVGLGESDTHGTKAAFNVDDRSAVKGYPMEALG